MEGLGMILLLLGPALVALAALWLAIVLLRRPKPLPHQPFPIGRYLAIGVLLLLFLGIGTCYGAMFSADFR